MPRRSSRKAPLLWATSVRLRNARPREGAPLHILAVMQPAIREGVPVVVLEPSCLSVFREEMTNLLADNDDAKRFREQTMNFSDFLESRDYQPPKLERKAIVHGHCHHKSVLGMDAEHELMSKMGLNADVLESGCCGMAGSFGYEEGDRYDVSMKAGERTLLPKVRAVSESTLILSNGFSCREQISQTTNRRAMHLAEALQMAAHEGPDGPHAGLPETNYVQPVANALSNKEKAIVAGAGGLLVAGGIFLYRKLTA